MRARSIGCGAFAEYTTLPAIAVIPVPAGWAEQEAMGLLVNWPTALAALRPLGRIAAGQTVLIHAAAGGVGQIVSQWAKHLGATVIGTVGSPDKIAIAKAHGCDHVFAYDDFSAKVRELTGGKDIAVTGTIDKDGNVGPIGGLHQKAVAVSLTDAKAFIVPKAQGDKQIADAQKVLGHRPVIAVSTLDEALAALAKLGGNAATIGTPGKSFNAI